MRSVLRVVIPLLLAASLLAWGASAIVDVVVKAWFVRDVSLRARLAAVGAQSAISAHLQAGERRKLSAVVDGLARDERIMAAEVCSPALDSLVATKGFPARFSCDGLRVRLAASTPPGELELRGAIEGGPVLVTAHPLDEDGQVLGTLVLVQDLSFAARRERAMKRVSIAAFALVALVASILTFVGRRRWLRGWTEELRRLLPLAGRGAEAFAPARRVRGAVGRNRPSAPRLSAAGQTVGHTIMAALPYRGGRRRRVLLPARRVPASRPRLLRSRGGRCARGQPSRGPAHRETREA